MRFSSLPRAGPAAAREAGLPDPALPGRPGVLLRSGDGDMRGMTDYLISGALVVFIVLVLTLLKRRERMAHDRAKPEPPIRDRTGS